MKTNLAGVFRYLFADVISTSSCDNSPCYFGLFHIFDSAFRKQTSQVTYQCKPLIHLVIESQAIFCNRICIHAYANIIANPDKYSNILFSRLRIQFIYLRTIHTCVTYFYINYFFFFCAKWH